jgi:hypothetical protein
VICAACGTDNRDGVKFCSKCGSALPEVPAAGYPNADYPSPGYQNPGYQNPGYQNPAGYQGGYPPPGQPSYPGAMQASPYGSTGIRGERREIGMLVLLTLVTCGIYGIIWWYKMFGEIAADLGRTDINPALEIVLIYLTCGLYGMFLAYKYPRLINEMQAKRGLPVNDFSTVSLILAIFGLGFVSFCLMQVELNKIWESGR